jgi:hypothetical protein
MEYQTAMDRMDRQILVVAAEGAHTVPTMADLADLVEAEVQDLLQLQLVLLDKEMQEELEEHLVEDLLDLEVAEEEQIKLELLVHQIWVEMVEMEHQHILHGVRYVDVVDQI